MPSIKVSKSNTAATSAAPAAWRCYPPRRARLIKTLQRSLDDRRTADGQRSTILSLNIALRLPITRDILFELINGVLAVSDARRYYAELHFHRQARHTRFAFAFGHYVASRSALANDDLASADQVLALHHCAQRQVRIFMSSSLVYLFC